MAHGSNERASFTVFETAGIMVVSSARYGSTSTSVHQAAGSGGAAGGCRRYGGRPPRPTDRVVRPTPGWAAGAMHQAPPLARTDTVGCRRQVAAQIAPRPLGSRSTSAGLLRAGSELSPAQTAGCRSGRRYGRICLHPSVTLLWPGVNRGQMTSAPYGSDTSCHARGWRPAQ